MENDLKYKNKVHRAILIADSISSVLLLLFLYTSLNKLLDHELFKNVLLGSPLLRPVAGVISWLLPFAEIIIAILLFIPSMRLKGLYSSLVLIFLLTIYLAYMVTFTPNLPCGCGGVLKALSWPQHIFFNLFFILLSLYGIFLYKKGKYKFGDPPP